MATIKNNCIQAFCWFVLVFHITNAADYATPPTIATPPDPKYSCSVDGGTVPNGQNFTTKLNGPCFTYRCEKRAFIPVEFKCPYNDKCVAVGTNITTNQCIVQQCQQHGQSISYQIVKEGCARFDSGCLNVGDSYQDGCTTYTCQKEQFTYRLAITGWGCNYGGKCFKANETITSQCSVQRCEKRGVMVGMYTVQSGCQFVNNTCLKEGEDVIDRCTLYKCTKEDVNGASYYKTKALAAMCEDKNGRCHSNGKIVEVDVLGSETHTVNCTCVVNGMSVGYHCY